LTVDQDVETLSPELVGEVKDRYDVGEHFARAYLAYWQQTRNRSYARLEEILSLPDPEPMWFDYAMTTNQRARDFAAFLRPYLADASGRYLDVGCGFGGYPCAFAGEGMEACGIEIDPVRVALSRANCRDHGLSDCIFDLSILDEKLEERLGRFDLITCMDVIEHVLDVPGTLENLVRLLNRKGLLLLEIPNKDSLAFVARDGHFNLFGITQLGRADAIRYHRAFFSFDYDVGHYHPMDYYVRFFYERGLACEAVPSPFHPAREMNAYRSYRADLRRTYVKFLLNSARKLTPGLNLKLHGRLLKYGTSHLRDRMKLLLGRMDESRFREKYLTDFWTLLIRKD
jgi:2-polyprenyl-3-methyl-5-hydroxy-6-metoxy-1,4-benzoquinol methylase